MDVDAPTPGEAAATQAAVEQVAALPEHYFELYSLAVEMADRTSARRLTANSFFVTVNTALIALLGAHPFPWYVPAAGIILSVAWWRLLKSYRELNEAKYKVILAMEDRLPTKVFADEWNYLKRDPVKLSFKPNTVKEWLGHYWELGRTERVVPWIFAILYVVAIVSRVHR